MTERKEGRKEKTKVMKEFIEYKLQKGFSEEKGQKQIGAFRKLTFLFGI